MSKTNEFLPSNLGSENAGKFIKVANDGSTTFGNPTCDPQDIADAVDDYMAEHPISGDSLAVNSVDPDKLKYTTHEISTNIWDWDSSEHPLTRSIDLQDVSQNWQGYLGSGAVWTSTNGYATGASEDPTGWAGRYFGYCMTDYIEIPENGLMKCNFAVRNYVTFKSKSVNENTYQYANGQRAAAASEVVSSYSSNIPAGTVIDFSSAIANGAKYVRLAVYEYSRATPTLYGSERMIDKNPVAYVTDSVNEVEGGEPYYNNYRMSSMIVSDYTDAAEASAKSYSDSKLVEAKSYSDDMLNEANAYSDGILTEANEYTDAHAISDENAEFLAAIKDIETHHSNNQLNPEWIYSTLPNGDPVDFNNYISRYIGWNSSGDEDQEAPGAIIPGTNTPMNRAPYNTSIANTTVAKGTYGATAATIAGTNYGLTGSYDISQIGIAGHWISFNISMRFFASTTGPIALDSTFKNCTNEGGSYISWIGSNSSGLSANVWYYIPADLDTNVYKYIHLSCNGLTTQQSLTQFGGDLQLCMRIAPGELTREEVEQLTISVLPNDEYSNVRTVYLDANEIRDGGIPSSKFDLESIAEEVPNYIETHSFPSNKLEMCETIYSTNVVDPTALWQCPNGWFANGNSWSDNFSTYYVSDFIPVPEGGVFKMNARARTIAYYSSNRTTDYSYNPVEPQSMGLDYISYKSTESAAGTELTAPAGAKYFRASFYVSDKEYLATKLYVAKSDEYDPDHSEWFEPYEMIKSEYIPESPTPTGDSYELINIANSDKIMFIGDSYTEATHSIENKAYCAKLSMFSDYEIENMAMSGDIYFGQLDKIRTNYTRWGTSFLKCNPKYAIMTCWTNDIKTLNVNQYAEGLRACCKQVISLGAQPLISTEYHSSIATAQVPTVNDQVARELGCPNWNYSKLVRLIRGSDYAPFWGGSHPGPRTNAIESDNMEKYLDTLERPRKSLKFFRLRDFMEFDPTGDMINLVYWNNEERAEKFKEIHVSHAVISNPALVDNITNASGTGQNSEYALMQDGGDCTFHRAGIMDVVIPGTYKSTSDIYVKLGTNAENFKLYVLDSLAGSYTRPVYMLRVDLKSSLCTNVPAINDVYDMEPQIGGAQTRLTVKQIVYGIGDADADMTLFCYLNGAAVSYSTSVPDSPGTLTKVSGEGDDTVAYTYRAKSYNTDNIQDITIGGWTELESVEDHGRLVFTLDNTKLKQYIHRDKLSFLFTNADSEGTNTDFTINHPEVYWAGKDDKVYDRKQLNFISNYDNENDELLDHTTFGTAGQLDTNFNITPISVYDSCYPLGCTSAAVVNDQTKITIELSANAQTALKCTGNTNPANYTTTEAILEVWARYFPDIYTDGSGNQITGDSYDYAKLFVDMVASNEYYTATLSERVNTHWKIVQFPLHVSGMWTDPKIRLYSNKDLQIAKISLKLQEVTRTHS